MTLSNYKNKLNLSTYLFIDINFYYNKFILKGLKNGLFVLKWPIVFKNMDN